MNSAIEIDVPDAAYLMPAVVAVEEVILIKLNADHLHSKPIINVVNGWIIVDESKRI